MKVAHLSEPAEERVIFRDGLGVREWRDTGADERVEWFHLDPCFTEVEMSLRDRVTRLAKLQHAKFARILSMETASTGAGPVLVSSHVPGTRFSEVLDMAAHGLVTVEPAAAVQVTREVIGALAVLHDSRNVTHGALAPERLILTGSGRVVVVEHALAAALDRLNLPRHQLWRDWRIATPLSPGPIRFDVRTDLAQLGLLALAALLGRSIDQEEYPHRLRGLLPVAQDKLVRSPLAAIATDLVAWLERLLPVESRRAFTTVKEAQQAFEAFVSARATSMIIAPARVKGLMSAVVALSARPAASAVSGEMEAIATPVGAVPLPVTSPLPLVHAVPPSRILEPAPVAEPPRSLDEIDIDALLRLEAELEEGEVVPGGLEASNAPPATLAALEVEREDLERQFAALVAAVAPDIPVGEPPAVRLRAETPETIDGPLVDPLVRWSSMPAGDLPETPGHQEADHASSGADGPDAHGAPAAASSPEALGLAFEPLVLVTDVAPRAAALDHVPKAWWREALPWRDEPPLAAQDRPVDSPANPDTSVFERAEDLRVDSIVAAEPDVTAEPVRGGAVVVDAFDVADVVSDRPLGDLRVDDVTPQVDVVTEEVSAANEVTNAWHGDAPEPAEMAAPPEVLAEVPAAEAVASESTACVEPTDVAAVPGAPTMFHEEVMPGTAGSAEAAAVPESEESVEAAVVALAPEPFTALGEPSLQAAEAPAAPADDPAWPGETMEVGEVPLVVDAAGHVGTDAPAPARFEVHEPQPRRSLFGEFTDLRIRQEEPEVALEEDVPSLRPTFAFLQAGRTAPTAAASLLAGQADAAAIEPVSWRTAFEAMAPAAPRIRSESIVTPACMEAAVLYDALDAGTPMGTTEVEARTAVDCPAQAADPASAAAPEVDADSVPEVVIVDGGEDADAFDALTPEVPSTPAAMKDLDDVGTRAGDVTVQQRLHDGDPADTSADRDASGESAAASAARTKRRRSRRKKAAVVAPVTPLSAWSTAAIAVEPSEVPDETSLGGRLSLLQREVPTWTPPADLRSVARAIATRPFAAPVPEPPPGALDEWGGDVSPPGHVASGDVAPPPSARPRSAASGTVAPRRPPQAMAVPVEPLRVEETIQAVGMPDLEALGLSSGRVASTSLADGVGQLHASARVHESRANVAPHVAPDHGRGGNWRRVVAAAVLVALFNGAAFAAWWWVQPGAVGTLVVQTAQPGVEVLIDGKVFGKTPFKDQIAPGRHKLTLRQGASVREMPVEISLGVVTTQSLDWPAADASARGNLQISSTPAGAEILIGGKSMGKAPQLLEDLPAGNVEVTLRGDAGTVTVRATVIAGETTPLDVPIFAGWVVVDAPIELNIVLRGARIGANTDGQILLSPGRHQLMAVNEALGFRKPFAVLIEPGEVRRVAVTVPPAPLQVQDEPGSEVFVDGERIGALPGPLHIPLGTHDVLVRRPDQSERRQTVTVRAGDTVSM